jgi:ATPase subunit of ABC transporter with duplicated ATPase domains
VGSNGSGKSTLLRLISGDMGEKGGYSGSISPPPQLAQGGGSPSYCAQGTEQLPVNAEDFSANWSAAAVRVREALGVNDDWLWRYETLSHGERKRLQLACALAAEPPLLALDEPTNHVDSATRQQIIRALADYDGVGLLVSHDRALLDALCSQCLFMRDGRGVLRPGNYSQGREQEQLERTARQRERKSAQAELAHLRIEQDRRAHQAARADVRRSKRHIDPKDHSAKARIDLARVSGQDGKAGKRSAQLDARVKASQQRLEQARTVKEYNGSIWLQTHPAARRNLLLLPAGELTLGEDRTLRYPQLVVENDAHIGLSGPNGSGKSSLLRRLVAAVSADIKLLYLPQELDNQQAAAELAALKQLSSEARGQVLSIVARLNSDPDRILAGESLSPGELRKLMLARGVLGCPQLIVMDEPTNHLDLHSTEALEQMLAACPCTLLLVSHDEAFLQVTTNQRWQFSPEGTVVCV